MVRQPMPILGHFVLRQAIIGVAVIALAVLAIQQLFRVQIDQAFDTRAIELGVMIDSAAAIAPSPEHLQYVIRELGRNSRVKQLTILWARDGSLLASIPMRTPRSTDRNSALADALGRKALASGQFSLMVRAPDGDNYSVLPLTLSAFLLSGDNALATGHWSAARWYESMQLRVRGRQDIFSGIAAFFWGDHEDSFSLPGGSYSGVVVINSGNNWIVDMMRSNNTIVAGILFLAVVCMKLSTAWFFRTSVHRPLDSFTHTIGRLRVSDRPARQPMHGIREFDAVAAQWNDLLDEQARTKQALSHSESQYRRLVDSLPGFAYICRNDQRWTMVFISAAVEEITGFSPTDLIGNRTVSFADFIHPEDIERVRADSAASLAARRQWEIQYRIITASGAVKWLWERDQGVYDATGSLVHIEGYAEDITALKRNEQDLIEARLNAEAANRAKSAFIANTNHEMRTPLNAIVGFSEMIAAERLGPLGNPDYREFAGLIESSGRSLLAIISTIMELSRLQSCDVALDTHEIDPVESIERLIRLWRTRGEERGIAIDFNNGARRSRLRADEVYLRKIVDNLLSNAVKFSRDGGKITVSLGIDRRDRLVLAVRDLGIGIARQHLGEVIQPFFQADKRLDRTTGGIGLGLTLVKEITTLMGAELDIASRPGRGTRVTVTFSAAATIRAAASGARCRKSARVSSRQV